MKRILNIVQIKRLIGYLQHSYTFTFIRNFSVSKCYLNPLVCMKVSKKAYINCEIWTTLHTNKLQNYQLLKLCLSLILLDSPNPQSSTKMNYYNTLIMICQFK